MDRCLQADFPAFQTGRPAQLADPSGWNHLEPNRLPDAAGSRVPDGMGLELPVLLAARLREVVGIVAGANDDFNLVVICFIGQTGDEWRVPALMANDFAAVHPHGCLIVDSPEVQMRFTA